ncbi:MAG: hypothetical protein KAI40_00795 [Desulfobacterales bacterium]|nr:hypothetical protein [Desulfobacterales bacterium]
MNSFNNKYTCNEYREEMILLGLKKKLTSSDLTQEEKEKLHKEIKDIEKKMDME